MLLSISCFSKSNRNQVFGYHLMSNRKRPGKIKNPISINCEKFVSSRKCAMKKRTIDNLKSQAIKRIVECHANSIYWNGLALNSNLGLCNCKAIRGTWNRINIQICILFYLPLPFFPSLLKPN